MANRYLHLIFLCVCSVFSMPSLADLPITVDDLIKDKGKVRFDGSLSYANADRQVVMTGDPIIVRGTRFLLPMTISIMVFSSGFLARRSVENNGKNIVLDILCVLLVSILLGVVNEWGNNEMLSGSTLIRLSVMGLMGVVAFFVFRSFSKMKP